MDLSIAMIVKNEEKNIEETLMAVDKLKNKINIEIIIVDTGSTDRTVEIAKKYSDKVFLHKWEDDFAKMRNISLGYCSGDWILVLDADEVLENPEELIRLFKSKEINKYKTATVKIKNYNSSSKESSSVGNIYRMFRRDSNVKYVGIIHERPICKEPVLSSKIMFNHKGYINDDYELMEYKFERNTKLLLKHIDKCGEDIYTYFQLSQSYFVADKTKEALLYMNKAISMIEKDSSLFKKNLFVYATYYKELYAIKDYYKCIEICKKVLKEEKNILDVYYLLSSCYFYLNDYEKAIKYAEEYFKLIKNPKEKNVDIEEFSLDKEMDIIELISFSYARLDRYQEVYDLLNKTNMEKDSLLELYYLTLIMLDKVEEIKKLINDSTSKDIYDYLINAINKRLFKLNIDKRKDFLRNYLSMDYTLDLYINLVELKNNINVDFSLFELQDFRIWKAEILTELIKNNEENIEILTSLNYDDIRKYSAILCKDYSCIRILLKYSETNVLSNNFNILILLDHIEESLIQCGRVIGEDLKYLINRRLINKYNLINTFYNEEALKINQYKGLLSNEEVFWYKLRVILSEKEIDIENFVKNLKIHVKEFNSYKEVYKTISNDITIVSDKEILLEKERVIESINELVNLGEIQSAKEMIIQLKSIVGNNSDIYNVEGVISYIEGDIYKAINKLLCGYMINCENKDIIYNINEIISSLSNSK